MPPPTRSSLSNPIVIFPRLSAQDNWTMKNEQLIIDWRRSLQLNYNYNKRKSDHWRMEGDSVPPININHFKHKRFVFEEQLMSTWLISLSSFHFGYEQRWLLPKQLWCIHFRSDHQRVKIINPWTCEWCLQIFEVTIIPIGLDVFDEDVVEAGEKGKGFDCEV